MIELQTTFVTNLDKTGDMTFTQVKKESTKNGNVYIYRRDRMDGKLHMYEVIVPKFMKAGTEIFGAVYDEDQERYPGSSSWGRNGWDFPRRELAEKKFEQIVNKLNGIEVVKEPTPTVSKRKTTTRPALVLPEKSKWTMKDLVKANPAYSPSLAQMTLRSMIGESVQVVGEKKGKRGKPAKIYSAI